MALARPMELNQIVHTSLQVFGKSQLACFKFRAAYPTLFAFVPTLFLSCSHVGFLASLCSHFSLCFSHSQSKAKNPKVGTREKQRGNKGNKVGPRTPKWEQERNKVGTKVKSGAKHPKWRQEEQSGVKNLRATLFPLLFPLLDS